MLDVGVDMLLILVLGKRIFSDSSVLNLNNIGGGGGG